MWFKSPVPCVQRWAAFKSVVADLPAEFEGDNVDVLLADCGKHRAFLGMFALQALPALRVFPEGIRAAVPFDVHFADDKGAAQYAAEVDAIRVKSMDLFGDMDDALGPAANALHLLEKVEHGQALAVHQAKQAALQAKLQARALRQAQRRHESAQAAHNASMQACQTAGNTTEECLEVLPTPSPPPSLSAQVNGTHTNATASNEGESFAEDREAASSMFAQAQGFVRRASDRLQLRLQRLQYLGEVLDRANEEGGGVIAAELHAHSAGLLHSPIEQFTDKDKQTEVLVELSVLQALTTAKLRVQT